MKYSTNTLLVCGAAIFMMVSIFGFNSPTPSYEYMTFTTIESIVPGGMGRSRMLVDDGIWIDGRTKNQESI